MATYTSGATITRKDISISFGSFCEAIKRAEVELGSGYVLEPEGISEGGILMVEWPDGFKGYKSMRLGFANYPLLVGTPDPTQVLKTRHHEGRKLHTVLKAFHGAPRWTKREVEVIAGAMRDFIPDSRLNGIPSEAKLKKDFRDNAGRIHAPRYM